MRIISVLFFVIFFPLLLASQNKVDVTSNKSENLIFYALLVGKWRSDDDERWIIQFTKSGYVYSTIKGSSDTLFFTYKLSGSCQLNDTSKKLELNNTSNMYLILSSTENETLSQCNEIENLDITNLSWMNSENGKVFVFRKIKKRKYQHKK
jgi:hypothetical protein